MKETKSTYRIISTFLIIQFLFVNVLQAEIFKCTNAKDEVYYNDKPCPVDDVEKKLNAVKDPTNGYVPPVNDAIKEPALSVENRNTSLKESRNFLGEKRDISSSVENERLEEEERRAGNIREYGQQQSDGDNGSTSHSANSANGIDINSQSSRETVKSESNDVNDSDEKYRNKEKVVTKLSVEQKRKVLNIYIPHE